MVVGQTRSDGVHPSPCAVGAPRKVNTGTGQSRTTFSVGAKSVGASICLTFLNSFSVQERDPDGRQGAFDQFRVPQPALHILCPIAA